MSQFVMTVKLGINGAGVTVRNVETGSAAGFTIAGMPKEEIKQLLDVFESNPGFKVKYE